MSIYPVRLVHGLEANKVSTNLLEINPGAVAAFDGSDLINFPLTTNINLTTVGLNGIDVGPVSNGAYYLYVIKNVITGATGFLLSRSISEGGVVYPSGFTFFRKLLFGFIYNATWGGIPNFHVQGLFPTEFRFTDSEYGGLWTALSGGSAAAFTDIDLSPWIPDNARMAYIGVEVRYNSGSAGSGYLRSYGGQATGLLAGSASPGSPFPGVTFLKLRTTSDRKIQYKCIGNVQCYVYVLGYDFTDPS